MYLALFKEAPCPNTTYQLGLNVDKNFTTTQTIEGLYFYEVEQVPHHLKRGIYLAFIEVPAHATVCCFKTRSKASEIIINQVIELSHWSAWTDADFCLHAVSIDGMALQYVANKTPDICLAAIKQTMGALNFVEEYSHSILEYINESSPFIGDDCQYYKVINSKLTHHGFQYQLGLNVDVVPFNNVECEAGLHFCSATQVPFWLCYGSYLAFVEIPHDAKVVHFKNKSKADKIIITKIIKLEDWELWKNRAFCLSAVSYNGKALQYVHDKTHDICLAAVKQCGEALGYVDNKTDELRIAAVEQSKNAILYVIDITEEICLALVNAGGQNVSTLNYVPSYYQTVKVCKAAVEKSICNFCHVPKEQMTHEICLTAVKKRIRLSEIDLKHRNYEICLTAVKLDGTAIKHVPPEIITQEICLAAVKKDGMVLQFIKPEYQNREIWLAAIGQNGSALKYIKSEHKTRAMCIAAIKNNIYALRYINTEYRTHETYLEALKHDIDAYNFIPPDHRTHQLCLAAVKIDGRALYNIKYHNLTLDICVAAVRQNKNVMKYVPEHMIELVSSALKQET